MSPKKNPKRYEQEAPPGVLYETLSASPRPSNTELCRKTEDGLNDLLRKLCSKKKNELVTGNCHSTSGPPKVDLVIVIDTSASMTDEATSLSAAAAAAVAAAKKSCPSDLRVAWLGIEGTWPATNFTQTYRSYLTALGVPGADIVGTPGDKEDGAAAIMDLSDHFDWRPGATRLIFYLGDEALEGGNPQNATDVAAANAAISVATTRGVKVCTYMGTGTVGPVTVSEYARVAIDTGGQAFVAPVGSVGGFTAVLQKVICGGIVSVCRAVREPKLVPCLRLRWDDRLKTDECKVLCITVCNPYSNVILKDFTLHIWVVDENGKPVPNQPNGDPTVAIKPGYMICFDDIPACNPKKPDPPSCVSREVVMLNHKAKKGKYKIMVAYCFNACFTQFAVQSAFEVELVSQ